MYSIETLLMTLSDQGWVSGLLLGRPFTAHNTVWPTMTKFCMLPTSGKGK